MAVATSTSACTLSSAFNGQSLQATRSRTTLAPVRGLPAFPRCHISKSAQRQADKARYGGQVGLAGGAIVGVVGSAGSAMALVDERLSTEGTGLGLGVSNPLLIWILLGVTTLIWALYFIYSSKIPPGDDDSGLSL